MTAPVTLDRTTRNLLAEALEATDYCMGGMITATAFEGGRGGPMVLGCPGPDARFVPMLTCRCCRTAQLLRRAIERLGLEVA